MFLKKSKNKGLESTDCMKNAPRTAISSNISVDFFIIDREDHLKGRKGKKSWMENENDCKNLEMKVRWAGSYCQKYIFQNKYTSVISSISIKFMLLYVKRMYIQGVGIQSFSTANGMVFI